MNFVKKKKKVKSNEHVGRYDNLYTDTKSYYLSFEFWIMNTKIQDEFSVRYGFSFYMYEGTRM